MNIKIRFAQQEDKDIIFSFENNIEANRLNQAIQNKEIILASNDKSIIAYLRFQLFWANLPYLSLIKVHNAFQRKGVGKALLTFLENHLFSNGFTKLLSSSTENESNPKTWHLKVGFQESGFISNINQNNLGEIFFIKEFGKDYFKDKSA